MTTSNDQTDTAQLVDALRAIAYELQTANALTYIAAIDDRHRRPGEGIVWTEEVETAHRKWTNQLMAGVRERLDLDVFKRTDETR